MSATDFETEFTTEPRYSTIRIDRTKPQYRNPERHAYLRKLLGDAVLDTFDPQVIKGACDGFYTGSATLYASEIARLARALHDRGAVLSWLGRGSHIANAVRKLRR